MTPRGGWPSQVATTVKSHSFNANPPSSTLAAQIIDNFADADRQQAPNSQAVLRQLLREILDTDQGVKSSRHSVESNTEINHRLIYVIYRAGVETLDNDDPFNRESDLRIQALDSLAVIDLTIRQSPDVLFYVPQPNGTRNQPDGPLFLWLIPHLTNLLTYPKSTEIQTGAENILKNALSVQNISTASKTRLQPVRKYIQGCIKDLLLFLEAPPGDTGTGNGTGKFRVPTLETISEVYPLGVREDELERTSQIDLENASSVLSTILCLLSVQLYKSPFVATRVGYQKLQLDSPWLLDTLTRVWGLLMPDVTRLTEKKFRGEDHVLYLSVLRQMLSHVVRVKVNRIIVSQVSLLLCQTLECHLNSSHEDLPEPVQNAICWCILDVYSISMESPIVSDTFHGYFKPIVRDKVENSDRKKHFSIDLQRALGIVLLVTPSEKVTTSEDPSMLQLLLFEDEKLRESFGRALATADRQIYTEFPVRPRKRVRLSEVESTESYTPSEEDQAIRRLYALLGLDPEPNIQGLEKAAVDRFKHLNEEDQCKFFTALGEVACIKAQSHRSCSASRTEGSSSYIQCRYCDEEKPFESASVKKADCMQKTVRPRIIIMRSLKRILFHTNIDDHLDLKSSTAGQWCLQSLKSSLRDLRIAAGQTITVYLEYHTNAGFIRQNRKIVLENLRSLSTKSDAAIQETCILAWGQVASSISSEDETNMILIQLVEHLGHSNRLIASLAYDELLRLSNQSPFLATRLFEPYWRTIAITVVKDIHSRPQIAQQICDLLGFKIQDLLKMTQIYTVPYLVLMKKRDVLQRIADACDPEQSIFKLCTEPANMAAIFAYLLLRRPSNIASTALSLLQEASIDFRNHNFEDMLKSVPIPVAAELLKVLGEEDQVKNSRAEKAIEVLAETTQRKPGPSKGSSKSMDTIPPFFKTFVLGIMTLFSETLNETKGPQPTGEKKRCLGGIREMIRLSKSHIYKGLPQICTTLRFAIEDADLCNEAFTAWLFLLGTLGADDIESLLDPTFAIIARHWESFLPATQQEAYETISELLKTHAKLIREVVMTIPSLASIPLMDKFEAELGSLKGQMDTKHQYKAFSQRCQSENATVVLRALTELEAFLAEHQGFLHTSATSQQPDAVIAYLTRSVLDACVRFSESSLEIAVLCAKCLGLIGCLDPTKVEAPRESREILVLSNFEKAEETIDFVVFLLEEILVKAFLSATDTRAQGFLAYAMQELLNFCELDISVTLRSHDLQTSANYRRWINIPESVRNTLTPFLTSKYILKEGISQPDCAYPLFKSGLSYASWVRMFVLDLLRKGCGDNASTVFGICRRIIRGQDVSIANFMFPYIALNIIVGGTEQQKLDIANEFLFILSQPLPENNQSMRENMVLCSESMFKVLDYLSKWMQEKKKQMAQPNLINNRANQVPSQIEREAGMAQISSVESVLSMIPAEIISRRAVDCKSYARALFHWEQHIRQFVTSKPEDGVEPLYQRLQDIYTQIDEPDGIEGISAHLQVLNIDQQVLEHRKAGRWSAVQSWYELLLTERPHDLEIQYSLLTSLKESGQHDVLLNQIEGFESSEASLLQSLPFAAEASWITGKWEKLARFLTNVKVEDNGDFNVGIGSAVVALHRKDRAGFLKIIDQLRSSTSRSMSIVSTSSLQACHDTMLKFHILTEIELMSGMKDSRIERPAMHTSLNRRLDVLGAFSSDKQYLLGIRRAIMQLSRHEFSPLDLSSAWLISARLARKGNFPHQAFNAVLHASQLGDKSATIEHSRLLWREGNHRKAIQSLEGAIAANAFRSHDYLPADDATATNDRNKQQQQNLLTARAHLLLAKWIDRAGQTQSDLIIQRYKKAVEFHNRWEKGHYYIGKHYNKLLESEKAKTPTKQSQVFISGEIAKLVIENYIRSLAFGTKYTYQTLPRVLTLWLELGNDVDKPLDPKYEGDENFRTLSTAQKKKMFGQVCSQMKKYIDRLPPFVFYTAFAQIVARICHTNQQIHASLSDIIAKVVVAHSQQALWPLLAMIKSSTKERAYRGMLCMTKIIDNVKKLKNEVTATETRSLMTHGQKLSDQLLHVCEGDLPGKPGIVSLAGDLKFVHKTAPCRLVIPLESTLTASLPTVTDNVNMKAHKAFVKEPITISTFLDEVLVLNSLQRPRKISVRGSDGRVYSLLCKPKDDLRKDQRLMEFNAMINRSLKRDVESSKRRLYIKTYAVTPLNEECGLIEWVDNLKTLRDIVLKIYKQKNVPINYSELRLLMDEACSETAKVPIFTKTVLAKFPPVFHEWFVEMFPEPSAWFVARLKYTRSCAVMSMVGHVLGLGDRHGENILFEEGSGGTFHVDFNCLFDKGLTFEKPELVPFRLTHNMVDAFGAYGYEGPYRKSSELALAILRGNEDTLMTILETFLYDPTTDFIGKKKRSRAHDVPDTPEGVLESVRSKVRGLLPGESVPLSVEGYVHELVRQATDPLRLASMYIGWCPFF